MSVRPEAPATGTLVWQHTAENRTLSAGEIALAGNEPIAFKLRIPAGKDAVSFETELKLSLMDANADAKKVKPRRR